MSPTWGRWFKAIGVTASVAVLYLVVAVTASPLPTGLRPEGVALVDLESLRRLMVPAIRLGYLALLAVAMYTWLVRREDRRRTGSGRRIPPVATLLALFLVALATVGMMSLRPDAFDRLANGQAVHVDGARPIGGSGRPTGMIDGDRFTVDVVGRPWVALAALAVGGLAIYLARFRRAGADLSEPPRAAPPAGDTTDDRLEPPPATDPSGRVIAAYRRVEAAAGRSGRSRAVAETVGAHLQRLTDRPEGAILGASYNRARFSTEPISVEEAERAESSAVNLSPDLT